MHRYSGITVRQPLDAHSLALDLQHLPQMGDKGKVAFLLSSHHP